MIMMKRNALVQAAAASGNNGRNLYNIRFVISMRGDKLKVLGAIAVGMLFAIFAPVKHKRLCTPVE